MGDYALGCDQPAYSLLEDLKQKKVDMTYGQLLQLNSSLRRQWHGALSLRHPNRAVAGMIHITHVRDIPPVLKVWLQGHPVEKAYLDGGAEVCVLTEDTMRQLNLKMNATSYLRVKMANSTKVRCLGCIEYLEVNVGGQKATLDFHVMPAKCSAYPIILGHPWLIGMKTRQDWHNGLLELYMDQPAEERVIFDMKMGKVIQGGAEEEVDEEDDSYTASSGYTDDEDMEWEANLV